MSADEPAWSSWKWVGVADAQRQQVQAGDHVDDVHDLTLGRSGDASA